MRVDSPSMLRPDLIVNGTAAVRSSLGARRYYEGVISHLDWPGAIEVTRVARWPRLERLNELLQRGRPDAVYWSPSHRGPLFAHQHVVTVLDCINIEYVYRGDMRLPLLRAVFGRLLDNAKVVVAISHATRDAVLRNFAIDPSKIVVIAGPVDFRDRSTTSGPSDEGRQGDPAPFVLMITNNLPHKNTTRACRAYAASEAARRGVALRIVGSVEAAGLAACRESGVSVDQHHGVDDATLARWIETCAFLFSPSLDEGLNLPVGEALSRGARVLCSDIPVNREFYDGEVLFCDPLDQSRMTASIDDALSRPLDWGLPGLSRPRSSFADVAAQYRELFLQVAAGRSIA